MCGIAGAVGAFLDGVDPAMPSLLLKRLQHRGPDDQGLLTLSQSGVRTGRDLELSLGTRAVLAHRRLAIIDLSPKGWQPMASPDGRYYIIFNGEIYNYRELRDILISCGHNFVSQSDTEVLLAAFVEWGPSALQRLVGMFAFAILDIAERKLFLARDFFGIKPLYYVAGDGALCFGSEIKSVLDWGLVTKRADPERVYLFLRYGITDFGDSTLFADVRQLPPAHYMWVKLDQPSSAKPERYWHVDLGCRHDVSFEEAAATVRDLFMNNVALHLRSDVPVGTALSGGIDSSSIVMAMRALKGNALDLHSFSFIPTGSPDSEERWVDLVGSAAGAFVHKTSPSSDQLRADADEIVYNQDEPFGSTSVYAQRRVFQLAQEHGIKVMLDGQGADEIFGGYRYFIGARLASLLRSGRLNEASSFAWATRRLPGSSISRTLMDSASFLAPSGMQAPLRRLVGRELLPAWLNARWFEDRGVQPCAITHCSTRDVMREYLYTSLTRTSLPPLLRYEDRNSMAYSIESRVPFLTPTLVEFALSLPEKYLVADDGLTKAVFRRAMRGLVPDAILDRKDKIGFVAPERAWLSQQESWATSVISWPESDAGPVDRTRLLAELRRLSQDGTSNTAGLWRSVNLIAWARKFDVQFV